MNFNKSPLRLDIMSEDQILRIAPKTLVNISELMSGEMGNIDGKRCIICTRPDLRDFEHRNISCYGHYAKIDLKNYYVNPLFKEDIQKAYTSLTSEDRSIPKGLKVDKLTGMALVKGNTLLNKKSEQLEKSYRIEWLREILIQKDRYTEANMIIKYILVPSSLIRSSVREEERTPFLKRIQELLSLISSSTSLLFNREAGAMDQRFPRQSQDVVNYGRIYQCLSRLMGVSSSDGILKELGGKQGYLRACSQSKRLDFSARYMIIGDPHIPPTHIMLPRSSKKYLKTKIAIDNNNIKKAIELAKKGSLTIYDQKEEIFQDVGDITKTSPGEDKYYYRDLEEDKDYVLLNRQPTLSMLSIMAVKVMFREDDIKTISMNPLITSAFNADFDGDEMNVYAKCNIDFNDGTFEECDKKLSITACVNKESGRSSITPIQDTISALYLMTKGDPICTYGTFTKCVTHMKLYYHSSFTRINKKNEKILARDLLSLCIPEYIQYQYEDVTIVPGNIKGTITKRILNLFLLSITGSDYMNIPLMKRKADVVDICDKFQIVGCTWLQEYGLSISIRIPEDTINKHKIYHDKDVSSSLKIIQCLEIDDNEKEEILKNERLPVKREILASLLTNRQASKQRMSSMESIRRSGIETMICSGAKGSDINAMQIVESVGQQTLSGERVSAIVTQNNNIFEDILYNGYCVNSYCSGLSPMEFMFNQMSVREGIINTSISTPKSGHLNRRANKLTSTTVMIDKDLVVLGSNDHGVSFNYCSYPYDFYTGSDS